MKKVGKTASPAAEPHEPVRLEIRLFGRFEARVNGRPLRFRRHGDQLIALLALKLGQTRDRLWLAEQLWPEDRGNLRARLRPTASEVREVLGPAARCLHSPDSHSLILRDAWVDVVEFEAAVQRGNEASLRSAVDLYRGPLVTDWKFEWVRQERDHYVDQCLTVLEQLAERARKRGEFPQARLYLERAIELDDLHEPAYLALMGVVAALNDFSSAISLYHLLRRRLHQKIDSEPTPETTAFYLKLLSRAGQRVRERPPRLEELLQAKPPCVVPHPVDPLIDRRTELTEIERLLQHQRLVTLTGLGGIGKTRLAIQLAIQIAPSYADGAWLVDLTDVSDPALLIPQVARTLGVSEEPARPLVESLQTHLQDKQLLLILDRSETMAGACADLAQVLLPRCPDLRLLTTSRIPLEAPAEVCFPVPSLEGPAAAELFLARMPSPERAAAMKEPSLSSIIELCDRLDGIPLAIELAASRTKALTLPQTLARMTNRFSFLTRQFGRGERRAEVLRHVVDWSYDQLQEPELILFRRLAVFADGWSLEATAQVAGRDEISPEEMLDRLEQLIDLSLIHRLPNGTEARYRWLETLREYAWEKLVEAEEVADCQNDHFRYYLHLVAEAEPAADGPEQQTWLTRLEQEHPNLRAALSAALSAGEADAGLALAARLWWFWDMRGYWTEGLRWLTQLLAEAPADTPPILLAEGRHAAGVLAWRQRDLLAARAWLVESREIYEAMGDPSGIARVIHALGNVLHDQGDIQEAGKLFRRCLAISQELHEPFSMADALIGLGRVATTTGDYNTAIARFEEAQEIARSLGDQRAVALCLNNQGEVYRRQGHRARARALFAESLAIQVELGDRPGAMVTRANLATVADRPADPAAALDQDEDILTEGRKLGDPGSIARALHHAALRLAEAREVLEATTLLREAVPLWREAGDPMGRADSLHTLAEVLRQQGDLEGARSHCEESLALQQQLGNSRGEAACLLSIGYIELLQGQLEAAHARLAESLERYRRLGERQGIIRCLESLAELAMSNEQYDQAARILGAVEARRARHEIARSPTTQEHHEVVTHQLIQALGAERYLNARQEGAGMSLEQAILYALRGGPS